MDRSRACVRFLHECACAWTRVRARVCSHRTRTTRIWCLEHETTRKTSVTFSARFVKRCLRNLPENWRVFLRASRPSWGCARVQNLSWSFEHKDERVECAFAFDVRQRTIPSPEAHQTIWLDTCCGCENCQALPTWFVNEVRDTVTRKMVEKAGLWSRSREKKSDSDSNFNFFFIFLRAPTHHVNSRGQHEKSHVALRLGEWSL